MGICNASSTNKTEELQSKSVRSGVILIEREEREIEGGRRCERGEGEREWMGKKGVLNPVSHINNDANFLS